VVVADVNESGVNAIVSELSELGLKALGVRMDVSKREDVQRVI
jgi:hypothetical protein